MSTSPELPHLILRIALCFVLGCPLLSRLAHGLATQNAPSELDGAIATARSKSSVVGPREVFVIANAGATQAIPALEEQFRRATDVDTKVSIPSGLVKLKDHDDTYWNFLLEQATLAVDSNIPDSVFSKSLGKPTILGPELQAWADAHNVSVNTAGIYMRGTIFRAKCWNWQHPETHVVFHSCDELSSPATTSLSVRLRRVWRRFKTSSRYR
jgi:hypothetical protein